MLKNVPVNFPFHFQNYGVKNLVDGLEEDWTQAPYYCYWIPNRVSRCLSIDGPWTDKHYEIWKELDFPYLSISDDSIDRNLGFLDDIRNELVGLDLRKSYASYQSLLLCSELEFLDISFNTRDVDIDFSELANLRGLKASYLKNFEVAMPPNLEYLIVEGPGIPHEITFLDRCSNLRVLSITKGRAVNSLSAISGLTNLEWLDLYGFPKLYEINEISNLVNLEGLFLESMKNLTFDAVNLKKLDRLKYLNLDCKDVINLDLLMEKRHLKFWVEPSSLVRKKFSFDFKSKMTEPDEFFE